MSESLSSNFVWAKRHSAPRKGNTFPSGFLQKILIVSEHLLNPKLCGTGAFTQDLQSLFLIGKEKRGGNKA